MHLQHCLPTVKEQLAASLSPYCLHPSLSTPLGFCWADTAVRGFTGHGSGWPTRRWGSRQGGTTVSILRTSVQKPKGNVILEISFYCLEKKKNKLTVLKDASYGLVYRGLEKQRSFMGQFPFWCLMPLSALGGHEIPSCWVKGGSNFLPPFPQKRVWEKSKDFLA